MLAFTSRRARELGLRMDLTLGSGWSFGGPYITPQLAATRLQSERREIAAGVTTIARPASFEHDRLVAAFVGRGSAQEVDPSTYRELTVPATGPVRLPDGVGPRVVLFYFSGQTGQVVKRAAVGADGYVLDHYNRAAIDCTFARRATSSWAPSNLDRSTRCSATASRCTTRTGRRRSSTNSAAPRIRPEAPAADGGVRRR